jgi:hypothetical protein
MLGQGFNMFTQVDAAAARRAGSASGLTLARTLVPCTAAPSRRKRRPGQGCEFRCACRSRERRPRRRRPARRAAAARAAPRVLVVDDNHDAADSLGMLLQFLGADVEVVHDGARRSSACAVQAAGRAARPGHAAA